jgi:tetratricopeptide (TPR) repeat protein
VKVAAALSTIIGVGTLAYQGYSEWRGSVLQGENVVVAIAVAENQLNARDYASAWDVNAKALEVAPGDKQLQAQQAEIAMAWLRDARLSSKPGATTFGEIANPLLEALLRRTTVPGIRASDLATITAHIGWARFLRSRDGPEPHIASDFAKALEIDPSNMYAHVMNGFFILWQRGRPDAARADFDAALQSSVNPSFRNGLILQAFFNSSNKYYQFVAVDYANRIRKAGGTIDPRARDQLLTIYEMGMRDARLLVELSHRVPVEESIATLDWALRDQSDGQRRLNDHVLSAMTLELAGRTSEALAAYQQTAATTPPHGDASDIALAGVLRLSAAPNRARGNGVPNQ